jgi:hypothetical protein
MGTAGVTPQQDRVNWDEFDKLVAYQCTQQEIADFFGISVDSLDRACQRDRGEKLAEVWDKKKRAGRVKLKKAQFRIAESNHPAAATMAIFLGKALLNQSDQPIDKEILETIQNLGISRDEALDILRGAAERQLAKDKKKTFSEFCEKAGYPLPFDKQVEMVQFGMGESVPRLLLGARGYGKTDYVVILGIAYDIYLDPINSTNLIMSKSKERNAAMLAEIAQALKLNGMVLDKENSTSIRVAGLAGKDHSVSAVTIRTVSLRGRHPKRIIMDDPVTEDDTSPATRAVVEKKYNELLKLSDNVLIIGQPAHKYDLYAKLRKLLRKMEVPHGTIPELDHDLEAQRLAGVDEKSIQASYFLRIVSEGATPFDNVKYLDKFPRGDSVAFIDPSHEGGDYTAMSVIRQHFEGVAVEGHVWKKSWNHCLDDIAPLLRKLGVRKLAFETNALGDMPIDILKATFKGVGVVGRRSVTNKHSTIMAAGTYSHLIHLSRESSNTYIDHVVQYEYKAEYDDAPDSLARGLEWIGLIKGKG